MKLFLGEWKYKTILHDKLKEKLEKKLLLTGGIMEQILYWLVGGVGVPVVNWLKQIFVLEGKAAMVLTAVVSGILAFAALFIHQQMSISELTWATMAAVFGQVLASATLAYKLLLKGE